MGFNLKLENLGPEHTVGFLSEEFFDRVLFPNMDSIAAFVKSETMTTNLYVYANNVWIYTENNLRDQFEHYVDAVIDILEGNKEIDADREQASKYIKDYITEHKLIKWFKMG